MIRGKLATAARLGGADRRLMLEAATALIAARRTSARPFRDLATRLGGLAAPGTAPANIAALSRAERDVVHRVRWAVAAVASWLPLRTRCLQQAIAARAMLERRGIGSVLHLGVGDPTGVKLEAHAWLDTDGIEVTGYPVDPALHEAGRFV